MRLNNNSEIATAVILLTLATLAFTAGAVYVLAMVASAGWHAVSP